jgi:hypothetical protein
MKTSLLLATALLVATLTGCGSKDERKRLDTSACDDYTATLAKVDACTKLDAAAKATIDQARRSAQVVIDLDEQNSTTDTKHVRANTCRSSQKAIEAVLAPTGC